MVKSSLEREIEKDGNIAGKEEAKDGMQPRRLQAHRKMKMNSLGHLPVLLISTWHDGASLPFTPIQQCSSDSSRPT
jgi:hypothetical protein